MLPLLYTLHDALDEVISIVLTLLGQVQIDHGSLETRMAHVFLDNPEVNARFQQMGGVGVTKRMDGHLAFADTDGPLGFAEGTPLRCFWPWGVERPGLMGHLVPRRGTGGGDGDALAKGYALASRWLEAGAQSGLWRPCRDVQGSSSADCRYRRPPAAALPEGAGHRNRRC
jgi:hypothetical protein